MDYTTLICAILGSGVLSTLINQLFAWRARDKANDTALNKAVLSLLHDKLQTLAKDRLSDGKIDVDDLENMTGMYESYTALGGNGTIKKLMERVYQLPVV